MVKVKVLSRNPNDYKRETNRDPHYMPRNFAPELHPFSDEREFVRALNATKLDKVFAKPFICSLDGHRAGVETIAKHPKSLSLVASGCADGHIRVWNVGMRCSVGRYDDAHNGVVNGLCYNDTGDLLLSIGSDNVIRHWRHSTADNTDVQLTLSQEIPSNELLHHIDYNQHKNIFATSGSKVSLYDITRMEPYKTLSWSMDSVGCLRFNPTEGALFAACGSDRSVMLYDSRADHPLQKVVLTMKSNSVCWNPQQPYFFTLANEDYNLYTFDMRNLSRPHTIHKGHILAVMDIDYSPTGREFVSGGYDKSIRIYDTLSGLSKEIYHTKRMQRVLNVKWTLDGRYLLSASDEMNLRLWKACASEKIGTIAPRERANFAYQARLKEKYKHHPEIRSISKHKHVPRHILHGQQELATITQAQKKKFGRVREHAGDKRKDIVAPVVPAKDGVVERDTIDFGT